MSGPPARLGLDMGGVPGWLAAGRLGDLWRAAREAARLVEAGRRTLATAESLTGGWLSASLTSIPGVSEYYLAGFTAYSNQAKVDLLGVPEDVLRARGAVSSECAEAMAAGALLRAGSDLALSTTGVAGPSGGSPEKPVGLAYVSATDGVRTLTKACMSGGSRLDVSLATAVEAWALLARLLSEPGSPDV
ncbi:MAG: nicotinamide-nucleotide amidohydrolase family protein [Deltaproteobacteria bacterium]|jgi:PncC family amidohydrolase|nr:nicotinamide-nucleotide amidohydrolase family protein [Deltaproteobacteria bacterium]